MIDSNLIYLGAPSMRSTAYVELKSAFRRKTGLASGRSVRITNRSKMLQEKALRLGTYKQTNSSRTTNSLALCWDPRCSCIAGCPFPLPWPLLLPLCCPASVVLLLCFALFFLSPPSPCFFSLLCFSNLKLASCRGVTRHDITNEVRWHRGIWDLANPMCLHPTRLDAICISGCGQFLRSCLLTLMLLQSWWSHMVILYALRLNNSRQFHRSCLNWSNCDAPGCCCISGGHKWQFFTPRLAWST